MAKEFLGSMDYIPARPSPPDKILPMWQCPTCHPSQVRERRAVHSYEDIYDLIEWMHEHNVLYHSG